VPDINMTQNGVQSYIGIRIRFRFSRVLRADRKHNILNTRHTNVFRLDAGVPAA